jgi:hypothetical protein
MIATSTIERLEVWYEREITNVVEDKKHEKYSTKNEKKEFIVYRNIFFSLFLSSLLSSSRSLCLCEYLCTIHFILFVRMHTQILDFSFSF